MASPLTKTLNTYPTGALAPVTNFYVPNNSLSSKHLGISICNPIYDDKAMTLALRHATYSAIFHTEATATHHMDHSKKYTCLQQSPILAQPLGPGSLPLGPGHPICNFALET
eukprot:1137819-Pelagomonas_calceolata.AAC.2